VFGLNAAKPYGISPEEIRRRTASDRVAGIKQAYLEDPDPSFASYGPKTRREFFDLLRLKGGPL
jgi:hypothetical protein